MNRLGGGFGEAFCRKAFRCSSIRDSGGEEIMASISKYIWANYIAANGLLRQYVRVVH